MSARIKLGLLAAFVVAAVAAQPATAAADFGIADVNVPGAPSAPAFSGEDADTGELALSTKAIWAGTCDLTSADTTDGGVGAHNGGIEPPSFRAHCMDMGPGSAVQFSPWVDGTAPRWRLSPVTQAGAHPDATAAFYFSRGADGYTEGAVKNIIVKLPPGVVGNPEVLPKCSAVAVQAVPPDCSAASQAGIGTLNFGESNFSIRNEVHDQSHPVYGVDARDTVTAEFTIAYVSGLFNVPLTARGRTNSDYGVDTLALLIPNFVPLAGQSFTFWGVPWAADHDKFRIDSLDSGQAGTFTNPLTDDYLQKGVKPEYRRPYDPDDPAFQDGEGNPLPIRPFFTNPTECSGRQLPVTVEMDSWQDPVSRGGEYLSATVLADILDGCDELVFDPSISLRPTVEVADSPSGLDVKLSIPQNNEPPAEALGNPNLPFDPADDNGAPAYWRTPAGRATAHLEDTTVRLPAGTSFNPAAANGLRGCSTREIGLTSLAPKVTFNNDLVQCPDTAKIGTLKIVTPLLPDPLLGDVYAAPQDDNPFPGSLTAIYMVAQDEERGLSVKLAGKVDLDPDTGQISTSFVDNPQLPFSSFELNFKTGPRAPLNTPATCGHFENSTDLTPWSFPESGPQPTIHDPFDITAMPNSFACVSEPEDRTFAPGFEAGSTNPQAGAHTSFVLNLTRRDGEQEIGGLTLDMPPGLTAKLAGTPYCPDASLAAIESSRTGLAESTASLCPAASGIGRVDSLAGAGELPLPTQGKLYLAGPYDPDGAGPKPTAPISVAAVVPAIAGGVPGDPAFDLGNVVVRSAAYVNRSTAQVQVSSAPLPYITGGVPLRIRRISVAIDKPGFMLNPTNCSELAVGGQIAGAADPLVRGDESSAAVSNRFAVGNCEALGFKPKLSLRVKGKPKRGSYQALVATMTARPGDANIGRVAVTMPPSLFLAQEHLNTICTRVQFAAKACPPGSVYGYASGTTPLLDAPISGLVYLRSSSNPLPDLVAVLRGPDHQPIEIELVGRTDSVDQSLRNTFDVVPDAPVSSFTLRLKGGSKALLVASTNLCRAKDPATVKLAAQNGRRLTLKPRLKNSSCKSRPRKGAKRGKGNEKRGAKRG